MCLDFFFLGWKKSIWSHQKGLLLQTSHPGGDGWFYLDTVLAMVWEDVERGAAVSEGELSPRLKDAWESAIPTPAPWKLEG